MLHKAQPSEGYWNVPRQGQEQDRGVSFANNAKCTAFSEQNTMKPVNKFKDSARCTCMYVCTRKLACVGNGNLESHVQVLTKAGNHISWKHTLGLCGSNPRCPLFILFQTTQKCKSEANISASYLQKHSKAKRSVCKMCQTNWAELSVEPGNVLYVTQFRLNQD